MKELAYVVVYLAGVATPIALMAVAIRSMERPTKSESNAALHEHAESRGPIHQHRGA